MSELTTYSFLPWLRRGIANNIAGRQGARATVPVSLRIDGIAPDNSALNRQVDRDVQLYGPGDVIGLDKKNIIRTEPRHYITNFEPNYLAFVDLYDEDLPWRYSPASPQGQRLQPWLALIILREDEFEDAPQRPGQPLPALRFLASDPLSILPAASELWAWAHVQLNRSVIGDTQRSTDGTAVGQATEQLLNENPDHGFSRVICPRRPEPDTAYHAFLVPVFESGRLSGLGEAIPETLSADTPAWAEGSIPASLPYYYRFYFRTGGEGDFEYLVRLLKPRPLSAEVGRRPVDVQAPGANVPGITDPSLEGVLLLGGALRVPDKSLSEEELARVTAYRNWDGDAAAYPHPFQDKLADFINLSDSYREQTAAEVHNTLVIDASPAAAGDYSITDNPDPVITAPLYGRWHALTQRLLKDRAGDPLPNRRNWIHQLNLDPMHRTAAGFGTAVIQHGQEEYMRASWEQLGEIIEANRRIRLAQLALQTGLRYYVRYLDPAATLAASASAPSLSIQHTLQLTAPLHSRVLTRDETVRHFLADSTLPPAALSPNFRRALRPRGTLAKRINYDPATPAVNPDSLLDRLAAGEVSAAPPREVPAGLPTLEDLGGTAPTTGTSWMVWLRDRLLENPWLRFVPLVLLGVLLLLLLLFGWWAGAALATVAGVAVALIALYLWLNKLLKDPPPAAVDPYDPAEQTPEIVDDFPTFPDFTVTEPGEDAPLTPGTTDSAEGAAYKAALADYTGMLQASIELGTVTPPRPVVPGRLRDEVIAQIDPRIRIPERTYAGIAIPAVLRANLATETFEPVMAYPRIDRPMYEPLAKRHPNRFLPNIDRIPQNTISLLETNQPFIEAYMVGLNHEMSRELLWREYFTDQRGSYFRQFWETADLLGERSGTEEEIREAGYDIPRIHRWSRTSELGDHDLREIRRRAADPTTEDREEAVLVIRGELLKKYPNAIIFAQRAKWQTKTVGGRQVIDNKQPRMLLEAADLPAGTPEREYLQTPLYEAQVKPDIYFFGFDLTVEEAVGDLGDTSDDDPGWFFVIKEHPGQPRLGLDLGNTTDEVEVWNDLSWEKAGVTNGGVLRINSETAAIPLDTLDGGTDVVKEVQRSEDININWNRDMSAADLAYILFQVPVLVAVHAADLIKSQPKE